MASAAQRRKEKGLLTGRPLTGGRCHLTGLQMNTFPDSFCEPVAHQMERKGPAWNEGWTEGKSEHKQALG